MFAVHLLTASAVLLGLLLAVAPGTAEASPHAREPHAAKKARKHAKKRQVCRVVRKRAVRKRHRSCARVRRLPSAPAPAPLSRPRP